MSEFYQIFKKQIISILYKDFWRTERYGMPPNSFYKTVRIMIIKLIKDNIKREP